MKVVQLTTDAREHHKDYNNPQPFFGTAPEALLEGFKTIPSEVEVHVVSCLQKPPISSPTKLGANIYYHALHVPNIGWMKTGYLGCSRAVRRKLREIKPDIVHGQGTERDCAITAVRSGYPNVLTIHGNMRLVAAFLEAKPFTYYWLATKLEQYCLRRTSGVVAISTYTQKNVAAATRKTWLLHNAVHPSYFDLQRSPGVAPHIVCVAQIGARKNQIQLMKSLDILAAEQEFNLRFAGGGSEGDPYFHQFLAEVKQRSWCTYLGPLQRSRLQAELSRAALLVLPSFEDNCPMVILEAAAAGVPVAASEVGGIPDLIEHGKTGLLFDPHQPDTILDALRSIVVNSKLGCDLAASARVHAMNCFSAESVARKHVSIYKEVLARVET
jgi:glycosyltransferase involved in cell wall biosynthesis